MTARTVLLLVPLLAGCAPRGLTHGVSGVGTSGCPVYVDVASVASLRTSYGSECVTLRGVVVVGRTDSSTAPRAFVQDEGGGSYSALMAKCDPADPSYPCSPSAFNAMFTLLRGESVSISGRYHHAQASGFEELAIESLVDDGAMRPVPRPLALTTADLGRDARRSDAWFQEATVTVDASDPLVPYDLSPPELQSSTVGTCPAWDGFALIATSAQAPPAAACAGNIQPAAQPSNGREILVARSFFRLFTYTGDCACAAPPKILVDPTNQLQGEMSGILSFEIRRGTTQGFQEFLPISRNEFPLF